MANIDAHRLNQSLSLVFFWSLKCCFAAELQVVIVVFSKLFDARSVFVMFLATSANLNGVPSMVSPMTLTTFPVNPTLIDTALLSQYTGWMFSWILMVDFVVHDFHNFFLFAELLYDWVLKLQFEIFFVSVLKVDVKGDDCNAGDDCILFRTCFGQWRICHSVISRHCTVSKYCWIWLVMHLVTKAVVV